MQSGIHALTSGSNGRSQLKRRGISLNFSAYGLFFYLYDEESRLHRNVGTFYTKMQRSFQGNRILMKCQQSTISQVDSILIIFHSREYKSLVAGRQFSKVTPNICGSSVWNVPIPTSWLLKFLNGTHVWKICASLLVLIYKLWPNLNTVTNINVIDETGPI